MVLLSLAYASLKNRKLTTVLTVLSIALSVALLLGVENVRSGARESFSNTISQTDLIVGARTGSLPLLLYTVFRIGAATNNIRYETYEKFRSHPAVAWTIPYSMGDSHRGFRVVGTDANFYEHYRYHRDRSIALAAGHAPSGVFDVAIGSAVAAALHYEPGDKVVVTHGISGGRGIMDHDDKPFTVAAVLAPTATPVDRTIYVTLEGIAAMHHDWADGAPPLPGAESAPLTKEQLRPDQITSFLVRAKRRSDALRLQREINTYTGEALLAVIPAMALAELWSIIGYVEDALRLVTFFVALVGLLGMLVSLYTSLNERRREMAILRALGAGPAKIMLLLVSESALLSLSGCVLGLILLYGLSFALQPVIERMFGLYLPIDPPTAIDWAYLAAVLGAGTLAGLIPAAKAYRNTLSDGLSIRL